MENLTSGYRSSEKLTEWVKRFLYLQVLIAVLSIASDAMEYSLLADFSSGNYVSEAQASIDAEANDQRQSIIGFLYIGTFLVSGFLILRWIHRANYNARQLGATGMEFTPGWAIGWYFVPVFTLWKPYQAMKEIWRASHNPTKWQLEAVPSLLGLWWFLWIVNNAMGQGIFRLSMRAEEIDELMLVNVLTMISDAVDIPLTLCLLSIVNKIYSVQINWLRNGS